MKGSPFVTIILLVFLILSNTFELESQPKKIILLEEYTNAKYDCIPLLIVK